MTVSVLQAFKATPRRNFLPTALAAEADVDAALPIGYGQTNSQPFTVRLMLEWLDVQPGDKVLDVGSGSGWTTALLSHLVGPKGYVYGVEKVPELVEFGRRNCAKLQLKNVEFRAAGREYGLRQNSPYDRILVSASADTLPQTLLDQLKIGGKIVIPVRETILEIHKTSRDDYDTIKHPGFIFVPLV